MAISTRQVKNKRDSNGVLTGRPGTVYDVNIKYTAPNGEKKTYSKKGFPTKKEATQHEAEMKAKLHNPGQIASIASQRKQTVASYLNEWVESYARVNVPFPVSWTVKMKKKQKETQDILSYHSQAAGCSDKARAKASGGRQPIEECGRTGL